MYKTSLGPECCGCHTSETNAAGGKKQRTWAHASVADPRLPRSTKAWHLTTQAVEATELHVQDSRAPWPSQLQGKLELGEMFLSPRVVPFLLVARERF